LANPISPSALIRYWGDRMRYTKGNLGRVFVARLEDGESIYDAVEEIARAEDVRCGVVLAVGGVRWGKVVTGPENPHGKVTPHVEQFDDARELVGVGTLFPQDGRPSLHFHAGIGVAPRPWSAALASGWARIWSLR
jgi:predicted DNA-binding protein with PD1-like motif